MNTPYIGGNDINQVIHCVEKATDTLFKWFSHNLLKSNAGKRHLIVSTNNTVNIKIENIDITNTICEELLGVIFDHKLIYDDLISKLCKTPSRKIHALAKITLRMTNLSKKCILMNAFFNSQFSYCTLVRMCHSRAKKSKINILH